jgi:hypothetical protein
MRNKKNIFIVLAVTLLVSGGYLIWSYYSHAWPFFSNTQSEQPLVIKPVNYEKPSQDQSSSGASAKENVASQQSSAAQPLSSTIPVTITSVQPGETVYIRVLVGVIDSSATCRLSMSGPSGKTYTSTAGVQSMASSSTCKGFNIPLQELSSGKWKIDVEASAGSQHGAATKEVTL